jgi:hypothetical protein
VKRQLITLIVMLAMGLQGSLIAFAGATPLMQSDCQTSADSQDVTQKSCCPSGIHTASCCLDACLADVAIAASPASLVSYSGTVPAPQLHIATFFSRGDSPLIRPPIL